MKIKRVCVYCGSSEGNDEAYMKAAEKLGKELLRRGVGLVYGGASVGIMGRLADTVLEGGGEVVGVIPERINEHVGHKALTKLHVVDSMHARKALMFELSDAFVAYPGGIGTLEEIFEILSWGMLQFHSKPHGFLNINKYYDKLFEFLHHATKEGFIRKDFHDSIVMEATPSALLDKLEAHVPNNFCKWGK